MTVAFVASVVATVFPPGDAVTVYPLTGGPLALAVNVVVRRSRDLPCLVLVVVDRIVHLDGTPEFFEELFVRAAEVAGTLRANDCGDPTALAAQ